MKPSEKLDQIEKELIQLRQETCNSIVEMEKLELETFAKLENIKQRKDIREKRLKKLELELQLYIYNQP